MPYHVPQVRAALDHVIEAEGLAGLPQYAYGASSGGSFVLSLPFVMPGRFAAVATQVRAIVCVRHDGRLRSQWTQDLKVGSHWFSLNTMAYKGFKREAVVGAVRSSANARARHCTYEDC